MSQTEQEQVQAASAEGTTSLLDAIVEASKLKPSDDGYAMTREGLKAFIE